MKTLESLREHLLSSPLQLQADDLLTFAEQGKVIIFQGEDHQHKEVPGLELQSDLRQLRREQNEHHRRDHAAEEGRPDTEPKGEARLALARHREPIESRRHRGWRPGYAGQDPGHETAG